MNEETQFKEKTLYILKQNETYLRIYGDGSALASLTEFFSFYVPGYRFMKKYKLRIWDGKIRLFDRRTSQIYAGLLPHIEEFAKLHQYEIEYPEGELGIEEEFSVQEALDFARSLQLHVKRDDEFVPIEPHDYQLAAFRHSVQTKRTMLLSPTASGKSLIIYLLVRYYQQLFNGKILIIVPTTSLVSQLFTDFGEYSYADKWDVRDNVHMIFEGKPKQAEQQIYISTWQSIYKLGYDYFNQFQMIIGDEAHGFKANSLTGILTKCVHTPYRFGTTGTLDGTKTNKLVLEGLFGKVYQVITTKKLQDSGTIAEMLINCLMLHYPEDLCKLVSKAKYVDEIKFLVEHKQRNKFIRNLAVSLKGNTLILFQLVKRHGKPLFEDIQSHVVDGRKVFFVYGGTETEDREQIRSITETETDAIIVASYGTFSTGINIRNLHNVIFASPSKSRIRILQSLGRGLRKSDTKSKLNLFDISDNLQYKSSKNHTLKHFIKRMEIYNSEKFSWKLFKVKLKNG
jgi:superfamily II DNA or RNA helicase